MKPLKELIDLEQHGWKVVKEWITQAINHVEILPASEQNRAKALLSTQVTTRSPMGAIIYETGGMLIDHGWIRILGSGHPRLPRSLPDWNKGKTFQEEGELPRFLLVGDDVACGFFAINGGAIGSKLGKVYYHAPDSLEWEDLWENYSDFLLWCFSGDLEKFYENERWSDCKSDIKPLNGDEVIFGYPFPFTEEGKLAINRSRKPIPIEEAFKFFIEKTKNQS